MEGISHAEYILRLRLLATSRPVAAFLKRLDIRLNGNRFLEAVMHCYLIRIRIDTDLHQRRKPSARSCDSGATPPSLSQRLKSDQH